MDNITLALTEGIKRIQALEQQLADKDGEIARLNKEVDAYRNHEADEIRRLKELLAKYTESSRERHLDDIDEVTKLQSYLAEARKLLQEYLDGGIDKEAELQNRIAAFLKGTDGQEKK